ncbi:hypothetical protein GP486_007863 [Trichoglossum hirsutum]|uniref:Cytochrome P450 n=1 Tax=Trichoglossum hirsutum TaxID=265104 RepID=A0A9P8IGX1_9PEZI|nr:hypothetical protein GP486_007863 [Trichoglossum hirsutum]
MGPIYTYVITGPRNVQAFFRGARELDFEFFIINVSIKAWRMPHRDAKKLEEDSSGPAAQSLGGVGEGGRIFFKLREIYHSNFLHTKSVSQLLDRWIEGYLTALDHPHEMQFPQSWGREWTVLPIYKFLRGQMLIATTMALAGPQFLEQCPTFGRDIWEFDKMFITLLSGTPRFLCRRGWDARDRLIVATERWLRRAWAEYDWQDEKLQSLDWEANFGHRVMRERERTLKSYGISLEGRATLQAGLIWGASTNAIPATCWMLIHILSDPDLYHRVREEITTAEVIAEMDGKTHIDVDKLVSLPLLRSVYLECLRLYMSVPIPRCLRNSVEVDGYKLSAGNYVLLPSYLAHTNEQVWSAQGHSAKSFWAERFLQRSMDETSRHSPGDYFPYGGGLNLCPGRLVGKQEIFAAVALLLAKFDFEFVGYVDKKGRSTARRPEEFDFGACEARGMITPTFDVLARVRRRVVGKATAR